MNLATQKNIFMRKNSGLYVQTPNREKAALTGNLARNLRTLARTRGSISNLCRQIGINRQQFNKYLSGASLPTSQNMRKICTYFGVAESAILSPQPEPPPSQPQPPKAAALSFEGMISAWAGELTAQQPRSFRLGCYFAYYPMMADPGRLIRVLIVAFRHGDQVLFKRYTRVRETGVKTRYYPRGKHVGAVIQRNEMLFLLGFNRVGYQDINLMAFNALLNNSPNLRTGLALIMSPWGPLATRVTLEYVGNLLDRRQMLRSCQVLPIDSSEIDPLIRKSMVAISPWPTPQLEPYGHLEDWKPPEPMAQFSAYQKRINSGG